MRRFAGQWETGKRTSEKISGTIGEETSKVKNRWESGQGNG